MFARQILRRQRWRLLSFVVLNPFGDELLSVATDSTVVRLCSSASVGIC